MMKKLLTWTLVFLLMSACQPITYNTFGTISGTVVDYATGAPIQNAAVTLSPFGRNAFTGSDGSFHFDDLDPTRYTVTAQKEGYESDFVHITVYAGQAETISITLKRK